MLKLIIVDDEGRRTVVPFIRQEITIGRQEGNTIRLTERNVSRHHARLLRRNGSIVVEDLGSYNGVRVNGERIEGTAELHGGDRVQIGDYELAIDDGAAAVAHDRIPTRELEISPGAKTSPGVASPPSAGEQMAQRPAAAVEQRSQADLGPANAPRLIVLNTDLAGREFPCLGTDLKVGRSPDNDIALEHESLSPTQARLMREPSGEWQIVDLESSNGVFVNGQTFGVARLRDGDVLQLGEVKLKFEAAPEAKDIGAAPSRRSAAYLGNRSLVAALVLLAIAVAAAYFLTRKEGSPPIAENRTPNEAVPPRPEATESAPPPLEARTPPMPAPAEMAQLDEKLKLATAAMAQRDFQKAIEILQSIKSEDGSRPEQVKEPLSRANAELSAGRKIDLARKSLAAGKLDETVRLLQESAGTTAFAKEHAQLQARAEASSRAPQRKKERDLKLARVTKAKPPPEPLADAEAEGDPAEKLYEEGTGLYRKGQYTDAAGALNQCLKVNPVLAKCHMALASTYAKLKEPELGAQHYRRFIELAPDDPQAARVKLLLEQYEASKELGR